MSAETGAEISPAAPHEPPYTYTANNGYGLADDVPAELRMRQDAPQSVENDDDLDDIFDEDDDAHDDLDADDWSGGSGDLTKSYNRQRQQNGNNSNGAAIHRRPGLCPLQACQQDPPR
ncbi:hypothetical protein NQ176_g8161 [Zarea fungicola]|uniref:Uncharacterized protein n=1 Tax=Zarea fungicola TaxID=93591 RepID=A0ACC1MW66_9HYPO|nr:hypothetical protein NQ176_g8161 [Lecanicillium fungicola]